MSDTLHIYVRVSSAAQKEDGTSLVTQQQEGERKAKELGMLSKVWNEGGQSSRHDDLENRPRLKELLGLIDAGVIKHLWVYAVDRLSRNETTWAAIRLKLVKQNVKLYTINGLFTLSSPMDKLLLGVLAELSSFENSQRADRSKLGKLNRIREGYWMGGPPPYGYKVIGKKLVPDEAEAKWVNFIFQSYLDGKTINEIRRHLLEKGVATRRSKKIWSLGSIAALLTNTHYSGFYTIQSIRCECEAIIPAKLFRDVADARKKRSERRIRESSQKHFSLLKGFLTCAHCGSGFSARQYPKQPTRSVYYCPRKERNYANLGTGKEKKCDNNRYLKVVPSDELVWDTVLTVLQKSALFKSETSDAAYEDEDSVERQAQVADRLKKQVRQMERTIREHGESLSRIEADKLLNSKTPEEVAAIVKAIEEALADLKAKRETLIARIEDHESEAEWGDWAKKHDHLLDNLIDLEPHNQRMILGHVVKSIAVETIDTRSHRLTINFKLPYYGGRFHYIDSKKPAKGHTITDGIDQLEVSLTHAKKNP